MSTPAHVVPIRPVAPATTIDVPPPIQPVDRDEFISDLSIILKSALECLLSEFDYEANLKSSTAVAARLLAATIDRLQEVQA